uniref:Small ubiquitin-related modifier n=1 Tax=Parascaris univalens TaxID=6257 RepID=A0A914ZQU5_PARUN
MVDNESQEAGDSRAPAAPPALSESLKLKVVGQDGGEMHFRVKYKTRMAKVKESYANHLKVVVGALRFIFDGRRISDDDTPEGLGMENEDVVEVYQEQTGGGITKIE